MPGHGEKLSRTQDKAISALLTSPSLTQAAVQCGVDESTLRRWLALPTFKTAYLAARRDVVQQAVVAIQQACSRAVSILVAIMENPDVSPDARVAAAKIILETALKAVELEELETRLAVLEAHQADTIGSHR